MILSDYQINELKELKEIVQHIIDNGGIMISGFMVGEYQEYRDILEEIIKENER